MDISNDEKTNAKAYSSFKSSYEWISATMIAVAKREGASAVVAADNIALQHALAGKQDCSVSDLTVLVPLNESYQKIFGYFSYRLIHISQRYNDDVA